jgi:hypothetical protein
MSAVALAKAELPNAVARSRWGARIRSGGSELSVPSNVEFEV